MMALYNTADMDSLPLYNYVIEKDQEAIIFSKLASYE